MEDPDDLVAPGSIHRGIIADPTSPLTCGYTGEQLPVYYKADVVLAAGGGLGRFARFFGGGGSPWQNTTPMANRPELSEWRPEGREEEEGPEADPMAEARAMLRSFGIDVDESAPRVVMKFPDRADQMLLSGTLGGGEALEKRAQVVDVGLGDGHVVMFAIRPFWRWQTQGTFFLGFNAILNWNDLGAGRGDEEPVAESGGPEAPARPGDVRATARPTKNLASGPRGWHP